MSSPYDESDATPAATAASATAFRIAEKKYQLHMEQRLKKTKNGRMRGGKLVAQPTDLSDVIDIRSLPQLPAGILTHVLECDPPAVLDKNDVMGHSSNLSSVPAAGQPQQHAATQQQQQQQELPCVNTSIPALTFHAHPGLTVFPAALPAVLQLQLMRAALQEWPEPPTRTNHTAVYGLTLQGLFAAAQAGLALAEHPRGQQPEQHKEQQPEQLTQQLHPAPAGNAHGAPAAPAEIRVDHGSACCNSTPSVCSSSGFCHSNQQAAKAATGSCAASGCTWSTSGKGPKATLLLRKLRWASLGPPFNWTARVYEPDAPHRPLPQELVTSATFFAELSDRCHSSSSSSIAATSSECKASMAGCGAENASCTAANCNVGSAGGSSTATAAAAAPYMPDVALVNYYHSGDTLNGHKDDVERDMMQPIVTMSLGCDAVFLVGGQTRAELPTALLLRSGDVVVLGGPARSCYHGVPRIFDDRGLAPELLEAANVLGEGFKPVVQYMQQCRVNISVRTTR